MPKPAASPRHPISQQENIEGAQAPRVLIVEDDLAYAVQLMRALRESTPNLPGRFEVDITPEPSVALEHAEHDDIDIYIVDLRFKNPNHPEQENSDVGKILIAQILEKTNAGLIVHSSLPAETDAFQLLSLGADDYIQKMSIDYGNTLAFHEIIRAKVFALWRRVQLIRPSFSRKFVHAERAFLVGNWRFVIGDRELENQTGEKVRISPTEHAFLRHLCTDEDHEIDLETFNLTILGRPKSEKDKRMDNFVYRIRIKLGPSVQIISRRDGTYKLTSVVERKKESR